MKYGLLPLICLLLLTACSSGRRLQRDYTLKDASAEDTPEWVATPQLVDDERARRDYRYFVSESWAKSMRLCQRSADTRATARIAREMIQFIKNTYAEATQNDRDGVGEEVSTYMQEQLAQETQTFVVGAQTASTYWEKRHYQVDLGAPRDDTRFACYAVVKIHKDDLKKAMAHARGKFLNSLSAPEVKAKAEAATRQVEEAFNAVERPIPVESPPAAAAQSTEGNAS